MNLRVIASVLILAALGSGQERFESGYLKGFTKSPIEHIINERPEPFTVRRVKGFVHDEGGAVMDGVLVEIRDEAGRIRAATTGPKGTFKIGGVPNGRYRFKVTRNAFQSVVGEIVVSSKTHTPQHVQIIMKPGV